MTPDHARALARYNRWMNDRLYATASELSDEACKRDVGAFFGSLHRTFNHLLVADNVWMGRFLGKKVEDGFMAPGVRSLDQELHSDFEELRAARRKMDEDITAYAESLTADKLSGTLVYERRGHTFEEPLWWTVAQLFNHETHHRGQATTILMQLGKDPGVTDLIAMLRTEKGERIA